MTFSPRISRRIAIVGPGALGCLFGGFLALDGHDVVMLARRPDHAALLAENGVAIEDKGDVRVARVKATSDPRAVGNVDLAIVFVKSHDTATVASVVGGIVGKTGVVMTLQNGLGNVETLVEAVGVDRVLGGVTAQGATVLAPGRVRHAGFGSTAFAEAAGGLSERAQSLASMLDQAGFPSRAHTDYRPLVWGKLIANAAINPLGAIIRCRNGELLENKNTDALLCALAEEAGAVARAAGVKLPFDSASEHAREVARATSQNVCSTLQDVEARRTTEIEAINGEVTRLGKAFGIPTPANAVVADLVRALPILRGGQPPI